MLDCNGDGLGAELKAHREYFQATRDQVDGMMNRMDRVIKLNGVQLKNNGTSWASKVEGKACEALDRLGQAEKRLCICCVLLKSWIQKLRPVSRKR